MLESLRRLWRKRSDAPDPAPMKAWAASRGFDFRAVRDGSGCLVEPRGDRPAWRMEWGASQRQYIAGHELRLIAEVGTPKELVAMVLTHPLMEAMEKQVFEQYVEDVQTRLDTETPSEMRWLVLYQKMSGLEMGRLREHFGAVCSVKGWAQQWLAGPLNDALAATLAAADDDAAIAPGAMTLALQRGRMTLRMPLQQFNAAAVVMWLSVFEHALREARRLNLEWQSNAEGGHSTQPAAWPKSMLPGEEGG